MKMNKLWVAALSLSFFGTIVQLSSCGNEKSVTIKSSNTKPKPKPDPVDVPFIIHAIKDNTLIESTTGDASNGAGPIINAGRTNQGSNSKRRGLIAFDISGKLPNKALIKNAILRLHVDKVADDSPFTVSLHRALSDWGEGSSVSGTGQGATSTTNDATWIHTFYNSTFWTTPGGDYNPAASASSIVTGNDAEVEWSSDQLIADIQDWNNNPTSNFGWEIIGDESVSQTAKIFSSREGANPPELEIEFEIDNDSPTVTVEQSLTQLDPTTVLPVEFTVTFSEPIQESTFTTADIVQNGTATGITWSIVDSGDHQTFTLSATALTGIGTIVPSMISGVVTDIAGNGNHISTSVDNSVDCDTTVFTTLTLQALKDNTLIQSTTGASSNGVGPVMYVGRTNQASNYLRRGLISFDIFSQIPVNATILNATLNMTVNNVNNTNAQTINLHKVLSNWGEGTSTSTAGQGAASTTNDATWIHGFYNTVLWTAPGGDYNPVATASTAVSTVGTTYSWTSTQLVADVQDWLINPITNFGWEVIGNETSAQSVKVFSTREHVTEYPTLIVHYSYVP